MTRLTRRGLAALPLLLLHRSARTAAPLDRASLHPTFAEGFDRFDRGPGGRWRTVYGYGGPGSRDNRNLSSNGERQVYLDAGFGGSDGGTPIGIDPFSVAEGALTITADRTPAAVLPRVWNLPYTSGLITTRFSFAQTYGHFAMRARLPAGRGLWPAFWLLPAAGGWPPELDVMEVLGRDPTTLYGTVHSKTATEGNHSAQVTRRMPDASAGFHTYGVSWTADTLRWYLDDVPYGEAPTPPGMHAPMYLLANLAIGGPWAGEPDAATPFPARMTIAWIRAYSLP